MSAADISDVSGSQVQDLGKSVHVPVLLHEVLEYLAKEPSGQNKIWFLDGTLGGAGHTSAIINAFREKLNVIGLDRDPQAIERARKTLAVSGAQFAKAQTDSDAGESPKIILECESFRNLDQVLDKHGIAKVDLILFDLGISSDELSNSGRGFSFEHDEPLLMTFGDPAKYQFTARDIVNGWQEDVIADIIFGYGEERFARRIAKAIVTYRAKKKIETSGELAEIVKPAIPTFRRNIFGQNGRKQIHPATRTFQALRIAVNDELNALREGLAKGFEKLEKNGRMAVISFHSLEDRIVKEFYKEKEKQGGRILTKKPIVAGAQEIAENPRSRSAKLRVIEKN